MTTNKFKLKVGLFGIGLDTYWEQFDGLKERLESYIEIVSKKIGESGEEVVNLGLIDNSQKAMQRCWTRQGIFIQRTCVSQKQLLPIF